MKRFSAVLISLAVLTACSKKPEQTVEEPQEKGPVIVDMTIEAQDHVGLTVAEARKTQLTEYLQVTGTVQPSDSRVSQVRSLALGRVLEVLVRVGDRVISGQDLTRIDNIEAGELLSDEEAARAELQRRQVQLTTQTKQYERVRRLVDIGAAAPKDLELAESEQQELRQSIRSQESVIAGIGSRLRRFGVEPGTSRAPVTTIVRAPFGGVITRVQTASGELIDTTHDLFTVADLSHVWVQAEVYEKDLGRVRLGQNAVITVDTYPRERFLGRVSYISDVLDPQTRTAKVRCELANPGLKLKLDMFATIRVPTSFSRMALSVPDSALQQVDSENVVFIRKAGTSFEMRHVQAGNSVNGQMEILSGLREGERVVTDGAFHLKSILAGKSLGEE
ncbi:MAG: efflux RND transporter periplasmic adaptor subunit [Bryobacteraceae bacterium]